MKANEGIGNGAAGSVSYTHVHELLHLALLEALLELGFLGFGKAIIIC